MAPHEGTFFRSSRRATLRAGIIALFFSAPAFALTVNRVNGGASVIYVDFSIPGRVVPLELVRSYNSITALNEATGWRGAFGWGWTAPFETTLTVTPDRQVILRDGQTGNNVTFRSAKEDPKVRDQFFAALKAKFFERKLGRVPTPAELAKLELPANALSRLKSDAAFRAEMADKYGVVVPVPKGEVLSSSDYGLQTIQFKNNEWVREKDGVSQTFDKDGRIVRQYDRNGSEIVFRYSDPSRSELSEMSDPSRSMSLKFSWRQGKVTEIVDNRGQKSRYSYDGAGNLTSVTDSTGQTFAYRYQNRRFPHVLTRIDYQSETVNNQTPFREVRYDDNGLVVFHREKDGSENTFVYGKSTTDPQNQFTTKMVRKAAGGARVEEQFEEFTLKNRDDGSKYLFKQEVRAGGVTTSTLFSACCAKPLQVTRNGEVTKFKYFENGLLKERAGPKEQISFEYDSRFKKPTKVKQNGFASNYEYDAQGNLVRASNSRSEQVSLKYDKFGRILEMLDATKRKLTFRYGENGKPVLIEEKGVGKIQIEYDPTGRIKRATTIAGEDRGGRKPTTATRSQEVVQRVLGGFQLLMELLKPAGATVAAGL